MAEEVLLFPSPWYEAEAVPAESNLIGDIVIREKRKKLKDWRGHKPYKQRRDKKENMKKVAALVLQNPKMTIEAISKETWLGRSAVSNTLARLSEADKDDRIIAITERDLQMVWKIQDEIWERLNNKEELKKMKSYELAQVAEKSERRYQIFRGEMTNKEGWLKNIDNIEIL